MFYAMGGGKVVLNDIEVVRAKIKFLFRKQIDIHISFSATRSKLNTKHYTAIVTGVYPNLFTAQVHGDDGITTKTFQYIDVLTGWVEIEELEKLVKK